MKAETLNERNNVFLKRKELQLSLQHDNASTPSKAALQELLAKQLGEKKEKIDIRAIYSDKGRARSLSKVFVWEEPPKKAEKKEEAKQEQKEEEAAQQEEGKGEKKEEGKKNEETVKEQKKE